MAIVAEQSKPRRGRRPSAAHFDLAVLRFESYEIQAVVANGEPWFAADSIALIAPDVHSDVDGLPERDLLRIDPTKLAKGRTRLRPAGNDDVVVFISETATVEILLRQPTLFTTDVARWILREAGPLLAGVGLREVGAVPLAAVEHYRIRVPAPQTPASKPHVVYRFFDEDGRLLYVGISLSARQRMAGHRSTQPWWPETAQVTFKHYPDYELARAAEVEAIAIENPVYNIADRPRSTSGSAIIGALS